MHMCDITHLNDILLPRAHSPMPPMCDTTHSNVWHDSFICVTWLVHMRDMTHSYAWHDSFICVTWLIQVRDMTYPNHSLLPRAHSPTPSPMCYMYMRYGSFICGIWSDSFIRVTWLIHCETWLIDTCDMTHSYMWHDWFICVTWLIHV